LLIVGGWVLLTLMNTEVTIKPSLISKTNTVVQILLLLVLIVDKAGLLTVPDFAMAALMTIVVITTVLSGLHYVWIWGFTDQSSASESTGAIPPHHTTLKAAKRPDPFVSGTALEQAATSGRSDRNWSSDNQLPDLDRS